MEKNTDTELSEQEIKPCPFCGCDNIELKQHCRNGWHIKCKRCLIGLKQKTLRYSMDWLRQKMIEGWNERTAVTTERIKAKKLVEALGLFLKVINRSPAALHHYREAIEQAEQALNNYNQ